MFPGGLHLFCLNEKRREPCIRYMQPRRPQPFAKLVGSEIPQRQSNYLRRVHRPTIGRSKWLHELDSLPDLRRELPSAILLCSDTFEVLVYLTSDGGRKEVVHRGRHADKKAFGCRIPISPTAPSSDEIMHIRL